MGTAKNSYKLKGGFMGHLTADERRRLETLLNRGESFRSIAEILR